MSDRTEAGGASPANPRALSARDAAGLILLALGAFAAVSVATDWVRGGHGGGANQSTAVLVGLIALAGAAPLFALGVGAAGLGAWLFGSRRRFHTSALALGALGTGLALPFAAAFAAPGSGGWIGSLAAPEGAGTGDRVLALALALILVVAGIYAVFVAFERGPALLALIRGGVSGARTAVKQPMGTASAAPTAERKPRAAATTPAIPDEPRQAPRANPTPSAGGPARDAGAARAGAARADLAAVAGAGAPAAAAGTASARPFTGAVDDAALRAGAAAEAARPSPAELSKEPKKQITLVVGGRPVRADDDDDDFASGAGAVRPVAPAGAARNVGGPRPIGTTPPPPGAPPPVAATTLGPADFARPMGTAPAPNPAEGIAPLPLGAVGGVKARELGSITMASDSAAPVDSAPVAHPSSLETGTRARALGGLALAGAVPAGAQTPLDENESAMAELEEGDFAEEDVEDVDAEASEEDADEDEEGEYDDAEDALEEEEGDELDKDKLEEEKAEEEELDEAYAEVDGDDEEVEDDEDDEDDEDKPELAEADGDADDADEEESDDSEDEAAWEGEDEVEIAPAEPTPGRARSGRRGPHPVPQPDLFDEGAEGAEGARAKEDVVLTPKSSRRAAARAADNPVDRPAANAVAEPADFPSAPRRSRRKKPVAADPVDLDETQREQLIHAAGMLFVAEGRAAVSLLQKRYSLDFRRSTEILDALQERGLIGPYLGGQRREILMSAAEWEAAQAAR